MLFDEPTSALDPELIGEVLEVMRKLVQEGMTMLVVTHEMGFAYEVADSIVFMEKGSIVEKGSPDDLLNRPRFDRTREFLGKITELYGKKEELRKGQAR
jgi:ABC-type polar amino acid transport system ATPase subunit